MKRYILLVAIAMAWQIADGQQEAMYTQFFSNKIVVNPAYAGTRDALSIVGIYRHQWTGFDGAPRTMTTSVHGSAPQLNSGFGLTIVYDQIGIHRTYSLKGAYAYHIKTKIGTLSLGLDASVKRHKMRWFDTNPIDQDNLDIPYGQDAITKPNFGFGIYMQNEKYFAGISTPQLLENELDYDETTGASGVQRRHYFGMAGVLLPVSDALEIQPAVLVKYEMSSPLQVDVNLMAIVKKSLWLGATYRSNDSFDMILQYQFKNNMRIGYAYDFTLTQLERENFGSHEIMIGYDFNKEKQGIYHPRYF